MQTIRVLLKLYSTIKGIFYWKRNENHFSLFSRFPDMSNTVKYLQKITLSEEIKAPFCEGFHYIFILFQLRSLTHLSWVVFACSENCFSCCHIPSCQHSQNRTPNVLHYKLPILLGCIGITTDFIYESH